MRGDEVAQRFTRVAGIHKRSWTITLGIPGDPGLTYDFIPRRNVLIAHVRQPCFDTTTVLELVRQPGLDVQQAGPTPVGGFSPARTILGNGVDGIDDDIEAEQEVGDGKLMGHGTALDPNGQTCPFKRCLCRVNPQVAGPQMPGERNGERGLPGSWTSRKDDQAWHHVHG